MTPVSASNRGLLLFDASIYVFKAFHVLPQRWHSLAGAPTHAALGFIRSLLKACADLRPRCVAVAFDESLTSSFRNELWPPYKANRPEPNAAFIEIFGHCRALTSALGFAVRSSDQFEADDIIATLVRLWLDRGVEEPVWIASRDKDLGQLLLRDDVRMLDVGGPTFDHTSFTAKYGVTPSQFLDYQTLVGDSVDNVPGVRGIGPITAQRLLARFGSLDALLARLDSGESLPLPGDRKTLAALREQREHLPRMREVLRMRTDVPDLGEVNDYAPRSPDGAILDRLLSGLGLQTALNWRASWEKAFG